MKCNFIPTIEITVKIIKSGFVLITTWNDVLDTSPSELDGQKQDGFVVRQANGPYISHIARGQGTMHFAHQFAIKTYTAHARANI